LEDSVLELEMKQLTPSSLYVKTEGRLDMDTAAEYGCKIKDFVEDNKISDLTLDFADITFISSFGLKVILEIYQIMHDPGVIRITNANEQVKNSFHMVGFDKFINLI
jgi:anti-sigma B factor antagonist